MLYYFQANLIGIKLMGRISLLEIVACDFEKTIFAAQRVAHETQLEAANWKEQFENAQMAMEDLQVSRDNLEQQKRTLTSELAVAKASTSQENKYKERLKCSFSEQLSKSSE